MNLSNPDIPNLSQIYPKFWEKGRLFFTLCPIYPSTHLPILSLNLFFSNQTNQINKTTKKTATRDLQELVNLTILIKRGRTGRGVYYILNPTYKGDIRGHKGT